MMKSSKMLNNERGGVVLVTIVIISVVLVILSGIATFKLTEVSRQAFRVNEAFRYLNIMEEMGLAVARARHIGRQTCGTAGTCTCPGTLTAVDINPGGTFIWVCIPAATVDAFCIAHTDGAGQANNFCLEAMREVAQNSSSGIDPATVADLTFRIKQKETPSFFSKLVASVFSMGTVNAACPPAGWWDTCVPASPPAGLAPPTLQPYTPPPAYTVAPTGLGTQRTGGAVTTRANLEAWTPTAAWAPGTANEILIPDCAASTNTYWLGCMSCLDANVTCIDFTMCPPASPTCTRPYRQRIMVY